jgi:hypothetical protein
MSIDILAQIGLLFTPTFYAVVRQLSGIAPHGGPF